MRLPNENERLMRFRPRSPRVLAALPERPGLPADHHSRLVALTKRVEALEEELAELKRRMR